MFQCCKPPEALVQGLVVGVTGSEHHSEMTCLHKVLGPRVLGVSQWSPRGLSRGLRLLVFRSSFSTLSLPHIFSRSLPAVPPVSGRPTIPSGCPCPCQAAGHFYFYFFLNPFSGSFFWHCAPYPPRERRCQDLSHWSQPWRETFGILWRLLRILWRQQSFSAFVRLEGSTQKCILCFLKPLKSQLTAKTLSFSPSSSHLEKS